MKLQLGERLQATVKPTSSSVQAQQVKNRNNAVYLVGSKLHETPWFVFHRGKKVFRNVRPASTELEETADDECLDVILKTIKYTQLTNAAIIKARRNELVIEAQTVLGVRKTNLLPEPLDLFCVRNTHDVFRCVRSAELVEEEPILVIESVSGETLREWKKNKQPSLARCLAVSAEILRYLQIMHVEGLVMHAIYPEVFWIDEFDQVHHVGSDAAIRTGSLVRSIGTRLPSGCCDIGLEQVDVKADVRSDLFAWAALTYFLITGEHTADIAPIEETRFPSFTDVHRLQLGLALAKASQDEIELIGGLFGIDTKRFAADYPSNLDFAITSSFNPERTRRADSVGTLLRWIERTPPLPVDFALALCVNGAINHVLVAAAKPTSHILIRHKQGPIAPCANDGEQVYLGPVTGAIQLKQVKTPLGQFAIFTQESDGSTNHLSIGVHMPLLELTNEQACETMFAQWQAESQSNGNSKDTVLRMLRICGFFSNRSFLIERMLASKFTEIRSWAISLIEDRIKTEKLDDAEFKLLTSHGLRDRDIDLRLKAARLVVSQRFIDVSTLVEVALVLGRQGPREAIRCLRRLPLETSQATLVPEAIELIARGVCEDCPVCGQSLALQVLDKHLQQSHAYVEYELDLVPLKVALRSLWRQVFEKNDTQAVTQLENLLNRDATRLGNALVAQLESVWLPAVAKHTEAAQTTLRNRLAKTLASKPLMRAASKLLLNASDSNLRRLGRETLMSEFAKLLYGDTVTCTQFMQQVDLLTGPDSCQTSIALCSELARHGASTVAAFQASHEYYLNELVKCSLCNADTPRRYLQKHERTVHLQFLLNGRQLTFEQMIERLLAQVVGANPQLEDVDLCLDVLEEAHGEVVATATFVSRLTALLTHSQSNLGEIAKYDVIAGILAQCRMGRQISEQLSKCPAATPCAVGILAASCLDGNKSTSLIDAVAEGVNRKDIQLEIREVVLHRLLGQLDSNSRVILLTAFAKSESDKLRGIDALRRLIPVVGRMGEIDKQIDILESTVQIRCPLCDLIFNGKSMGPHLETVHHKVWEGRQVRSAWTVAIDRLQQYADEPDPKWLREAERLAAINGGEAAIESLRRYALIQNIASDRYLPAFKLKAKQSGAGLCYSCYELLNDPNKGEFMSVALNGDNELKSEYAMVAIETTFPYESVRVTVKDDAWKGNTLQQWLSTKAKNVFILVVGALALIACVAAAQFSAAAAVIGFMLTASATTTLLLMINRAKFRGKEELYTIVWDEIIEPLFKRKPNNKFEPFLIGFITHQGVARSEHLARANQSLSYLFDRLKSHSVSEASVARIYGMMLKRHTVTVNASSQMAIKFAFDLLKRRLANENIGLVHRYSDHARGVAQNSSSRSVTHA